MKNILTTFHIFSKEYKEYLSIKSDPEKSAVSKMYGIRSIILSILTVVTSFSILLLNADSLGGNVITTVLLILFLVAFSLLAPILFFLYSLMSSIFQMRLNKKSIGWISLILSILSFIAAAVIVLTLLTSI